MRPPRRRTILFLAGRLLRGLAQLLRVLLRVDESSEHVGVLEGQGRVLGLRSAGAGDGLQLQPIFGHPIFQGQPVGGQNPIRGEATLVLRQGRLVVVILEQGQAVLVIGHRHLLGYTFWWIDPDVFAWNLHGLRLLRRGGRRSGRRRRRRQITLQQTGNVDNFSYRGRDGSLSGKILDQLSWSPQVVEAQQLDVVRRRFRRVNRKF